jgi:GxxExxY protein
MDTDEHGLKHAALTERIIGVFFDVYNELGSGFLESVYVEALGLAFQQNGLSFEREMPVPSTSEAGSLEDSELIW